jgi:hypothetical protein
LLIHVKAVPISVLSEVLSSLLQNKENRQFRRRPEDSLQLEVD